MQDGVGLMVGTWFPDNVNLKVRNGADTLFWFDRWAGEIPFQVRFRRLFDLSENKLLTIAQMFQLGWVRVVRRGSGEGDYGLGRRSS